ncbi:MAG: agmatine deiminase family protein [Bacteroidales bacterium]|nr:agmatine deiminase family protein [Bacteroidales bacterium]
MKIFLRSFFLMMLLARFLSPVQSQEPLRENHPLLTHWLTPEEMLRLDEIGKSFTPTDPPVPAVVNIAEFNYNDGVLVRYPFGIPMSLIVEMSEDAKVTTIVKNSSEQTLVTNQYQSAGVNMSNCDFLIALTDRYWTRDYGPWFILDSSYTVSIVDFPYNRPRPNDDEIPVKVAEFMSVPLFGMNIIHTGGNYMCDGMGIASSTDLVYIENPSQSAAQIAQKANDYLGVQNYYVRPDPNGTYIDHIDCWAKFLDVDKILVRQVPSTHPQYSEIEAAAAFWQATNCSYGYPFQVVRVNTPNDQPYTNSFILKNKVCVPITGSSYDAAAIAAYQNAMPGYEVIGFYQNASTPWVSTDALHCRTHEIADKGMLYVKHMPIFGSRPADEDYLVEATIVDISKSGVNPDSTRIYYKIGSGAYQWVPLARESGYIFKGSIPRQAQGSQLKYYISTADSSGRHMNHPYIGAPDPHVFTIGAGIHPHMLCSIHSIDTSAIAGTTLHIPLQIQNTGFAGLIYTIETDLASSSWMSAAPASGTIIVGGSQTVQLNLNASMLLPGVYNGTLYINSNDPDLLRDSIGVRFEVMSGVGIENLELSYVQLSPNPWKDRLQFNFHLNKAENVTVEVFNMQGQRKMQLENSVFSAGHHQRNFTSSEGISNLPSGIYIIKIQTGNSIRFIKTIKM